MWKLKAFAEGKSKSENASIIKIGLEDLKSKIKEICFIEVGININSSDQAYDIVLFSLFKNIEDLNIYQNHIEHKIISEYIGKVREERIVVDYEGLICEGGKYDI